MYWTKEKLLQTLPYVYRERDAAIAKREGLEEGPLTSMLGVLAEQVGAVEGNIEQLYENWFVETCEPWVLPYLGELLGIDNLPATSSSVYSPRAYVANMMSYRRRKGTPGMLKQLARDATGWHASVVEYFLLLCQTQHLNRHRPDVWFSPDLRETGRLELLPGPFASSHRLPELRNIDGPFPGKYNIPIIGLHLWPLTAFSPPDATGTPTNPPARYAVEARPETIPADPEDPAARWYLHPLGVPFPLFNRPQGQTPDSGATAYGKTGERDVPEPLRRLPLHRELEALRQSIADGGDAPSLPYFGSNQPVLQLFADDETDPIPPEEIRIVDFSLGWPVPDAFESYSPANGDPAVDLPIRVAVDPVRGQVAFSPANEPTRLRAVYAYGFTMEMGGGPYDRTADQPTDEIDWQIGVSRLLTPIADVIVDSLAEAIGLWNAQPAGTRGMICMMDSMRYAEDLTAGNRIEIPEGSHLTLIAADWPEVENDDGTFSRPLGVYSPNLLRPHLLESLEITGTAPAESADPGACHLEGMLVEGNIDVTPGHLGTLTLAHCTLPPGPSGGLAIGADDDGRNSELVLNIHHCRISRIMDSASHESLSVEDSILGTPSDPEISAVEADGVATVVNRTTCWGSVSVRQIEASESIFMRPLVSERTQTGCVRYSWLAEGSVVPRPFRCQPSLAIREAGAEGDPAAAQQITLRVTPWFESPDPQNPGYARLAGSGPAEIRRGGENRREMGVFASLDEPLREDFLRNNLDQFLRAGLSAGLFFALPLPSVNYGRPLS